MSHTHGPWVAWDDNRTIGIVDADGEPFAIAEVVDHGDMAAEDQLLADQALITAAPDMLAALKAADRFMGGFEGDEMQDEIDERLALIRAAIAKAEGR